VWSSEPVECKWRRLNHGSQAIQPLIFEAMVFIFSLEKICSGGSKYDLLSAAIAASQPCFQGVLVDSPDRARMRTNLAPQD